VQPELAILDLGLPDMDGLQVLRELQEQHPCAALILTGRDGLTDRVLGLELGADDYLVKPFEPRELVARVRSILRRYQKAPAPNPTPTAPRALRRLALRHRPPQPHPRRRREVSLSAAEAACCRLLKRPNKIHPRAADRRTRARPLRPQHRRAHLAPAPQARGRPAGPEDHQDGLRRRLPAVRTWTWIGGVRAAALALGTAALGGCVVFMPETTNRYNPACGTMERPWSPAYQTAAFVSRRNEGCAELRSWPGPSPRHRWWSRQHRGGGRYRALAGAQRCPGK
jgi:hypothetical protein